jgi:hypothetical protein
MQEMRGKRSGEHSFDCPIYRRKLAMAVFWILTPAYNDNGKNIGFPWETTCESVPHLTLQMARCGIVAGERLVIDTDGNGERCVTDRVPTALTPHGIASVMPYSGRRGQP